MFHTFFGREQKCSNRNELLLYWSDQRHPLLEVSVAEGNTFMLVSRPVL